MTHLLATRASACLLAAVLASTPLTLGAQTLDQAPSGSFTFGGLFGTVETGALPLEMAPAPVAPVQPRVSAPLVVDIRPTVADVDPAQVRRRIARNTWTIGVFR